jgi:pimeloyl-ACP methyl ester carboxylesterase
MVTMLARSLRIAALLNIAFATFWFAFLWSQHPWAAVIVSLATMLLFVPFLGSLFVTALLTNRSDPTPPASATLSLRAWWTEVIAVAGIFFWRQAFFSRQMPDTTDVQVTSGGPRGVVFIHGFICNRGMWRTWLAQMILLRHPYVEAISRATGQPPLLVCHSMGGLAARAWLRANSNNCNRVGHIVTIGTPHHGTWLGKFAMSVNGRQMRLDDQWLTQLHQDEAPDAVKLFTCFYSNCDEIVFPASTAMLSGAENRLVAGAPHFALAFHQDVVDATLALL